ncbi:hypothetical protein G7K_3414-t1 [Saitoella complicata NRRL Y-17804]|uniref:Uncharacterized protein n=1 Tax=Saitoella complicata (strain BCRC 22490 / CBS 7301 / JCM 7358 / NBRC 10748 / NRRL Y-17804) TaxID=698492 RepID=A0A0E9NHT2_SAICN|nr:hypothetical protein G7K_3414-t1 [Saitoella complicata NRRL Y-17804]
MAERSDSVGSLHDHEGAWEAISSYHCCLQQPCPAPMSAVFNPLVNSLDGVAYAIPGFVSFHHSSSDITSTHSLLV